MGIAWGIVRRRLMDWLVINTTSERGRMLRADHESVTLPALYVIAGLYDNDKMGAVASGLMNNPRLVASKLAYSIFPDDESVKPLNYDEKKLADTPEALWSEGEIKLYGQKKADLPVVQNPGDSAKQEDDKEEKRALTRVQPSRSPYPQQQPGRSPPAPAARAVLGCTSSPSHART